MTDPYNPMKMLQKTAITKLAMTIRGHKRIVRPAMGIQAVSKKGPSRLIRSCMRRCQPLNSMYGLFTTAIAVYSGISTISPIIPTIIHAGICMNLQVIFKEFFLIMFSHNQIHMCFY